MSKLSLVELRERVPAPPDHITLEKVLVTPALAAEYLNGRMHRNRVKSRIQLEIHKQNLANDTWFAEISPVYVDDKDISWDAQHRFQAIFDTGISAWMVFIRGVTAEAAEYADTGRSRQYADNLKRRGVQDYKRQSVLAKYIALNDMYGIDGIRNPGKYAVSQSEKDKHIYLPDGGQNQAVVDSIRLGQGLYRATGANEGWMAWAVYATGKGADPDGFWDQVMHGEGLHHGDPALTLREWLMQGRKRTRVPADKRLMELYATTMCWNKHVDRESYSKVQPSFEPRPDGTRYFPAANVPDFKPLVAGTYDKHVPRRASDLDRLRAVFSGAASENA